MTARILILLFLLDPVSKGFAGDLETDLKAALRSFMASPSYKDAKNAHEMHAEAGRLILETIEGREQEIEELARRDFDRMPVLQPESLPKLIRSTDRDYEAAMKESGTTFEAWLRSDYGARTVWDLLVPSRASQAGVNMLMLAEDGSDKVRRALLSSMFPRKFFRLNDDFSKPVIGIDALEAFYVIRLRRNGNCFIPVGGDQHEPMVEQVSGGNGGQAR